MLKLLCILALVLAKIKVFIVLHSHNDVGWIETVDSYYENQSKKILDNMLEILQKNPTLKFSWAEVYYLSRYLQDYPNKKPIIQRFIKEERLEIVGGGWVQSDEALPDFELVIRQMETGFNYLRAELNVTKIKTGWQLDPFGHSSLTAALWEKMGFESLVISRMEQTQRAYLEKTGNCEFIWRGKGFGSKNGVLTHLLNEHYYPPNFLDRNPWSGDCCFNYLPATEDNIIDCVNKFEYYVNTTRHKYKTNNLMMLIGGDFFYSMKNETTMFLDLLSTIIANSTNLDIKFATPSEYFRAVYESKPEFGVFEGDLFPYISKGVPYYKTWTGFYSTKPTLKKEISEVQSLVRAAEILQSKVMNKSFISYNLPLTSHHDAITGTCKPLVFLNYLKLLDQDRQLSYQALIEVFKMALPNDGFKTELIVPYKVLYLFNPLDWPVSKTINFDSKFKFIKVIGSYGEVLSVQSVPWNDGFRFHFKYTLGGYSLSVVFVNEFSDNCKGCSFESELNFIPFISNKHLELSFSQGLLHQISNSKGKYMINTQLLNYSTEFSGAYIFCPYKFPETSGIVTSFAIYTGFIVQVAVSKFLSGNETFIQRIILEHDSKELKINFALKPPPNSDVFLRFNRTHLGRAWFYTFNTANIMKRYFEYDNIMKKGSNYYPINGAMFIDLVGDYMYLIPSFPIMAGMASEDTFELNLHRFTIYDDGMGLGQMKEQSYMVEHDIILGFNSPEYTFIWKKVLEHKNQPLTFFSSKNSESLSKNIESADYFIGNWNKKTKVKLIEGNSCSHIVSLSKHQYNYLTTVINICGMPSDYPFNPDQIVNIGGSDLDGNKRRWKTGKKICFVNFNNSGYNVMNYPDAKNVGKIAAFNLVTFRTKLNYELEAEFIFGINKEKVIYILIGFALLIAFKKVLNKFLNKKDISHKV